MSSSTVEELELMNDSKYKVYITAVDKALKNFEYSTEWADFVSALAKLNKVIQSHSKFPVIPRKIKISKRLAQCMHPTLPSGVHKKALDTYNTIFKCIGTNRLSQELFIYSAGLFPLLGYAEQSVRPILLGIYETHFVPLGERLGPALSGFLSGVLPGLEEGYDYYDRTIELLHKVCEGVGPPIFYGHLWECLASNEAIRLAAITFILGNFDKKKTMEDQLYIMGTNVDVMVNGLCACVEDSGVLVQRSVLDLLLVGFPMHNKQLVRSDMTRIVTAALDTLLRRDMSLNRRLFAWLLGSEVNMALVSAEVQQSKEVTSLDTVNWYFETYSRELLTQAIKITLNEATSHNPHNLNPYKILISLIDKPEIGPVILDDILYEVFRLLYLCYHNPGSKASNSSELLKAANLLFGALEPRYLWQYTGTLFSDACKNMKSRNYDEYSEQKPVQPVGSGYPILTEVCAIIEFLLDVVLLETYSETPSELLPSLFLHIITTLTDQCDSLSANQMTVCLQLCTRLLSRITPSVVMPQPVDPPAEATVVPKSKPAQQPGKAVPVKSLEPKKEMPQPLSRVDDFSSIDSEVSTLSEFLPSKSLENLSSLDTITLTEDATSQNLSIATYSTLEASTAESPNSVRSAEQNSIMEKCLKQYEKFYVTFVYGVRVKIGETKGVSVLLDALKIKSNISTVEDRTKQLEKLLRLVIAPDSSSSDSCVVPFSSTSDSAFAFSDSDYSSARSECCDSLGSVWTKSMHLSSKLLVEFSTFQTSVGDSVLVRREPSLEDELLPEWLQVLIVCACWLGTTAPSLQLVAIATLLDLVSLCQTQNQLPPSNQQAGIIPVLIIPLLKPNHLNYIENCTNSFQMIAYWLWNHLGTPRHQVRCVELLHQLQSVLHHSDITENCIGETLVSPAYSDTEKLASFRKFAVLWHVGREVTGRMGNSLQLSDIFYKSMLKMLDNLQLSECRPLKIEAQLWLLHSLLRDDIHRMIDPLLFILLDPLTARLGVLQAKVQQADTNDNTIKPSSNAEDPSKNTKIYAISSVDGNIMYHVSEKYHNKKLFKDPSVIHTNKGKKIFAVTSLTNRDVCSDKMMNQFVDDKAMEAMNKDTTDYYRSGSKNVSLLKNISVFVNPFASDQTTSSMNNDFDDYFIQESKSEEDFVPKLTTLSPEPALKKRTKSPLSFKFDNRKRKEKSAAVVRNNSYSSLENLRNSLVVNPSSMMMNSIDLLNFSKISDTIFVKVSDGKSFFSRKSNNTPTRNSLTDDNLINLSTLQNNDNGELVRSWSFSNTTPAYKRSSSQPDLEESTPADEYFEPVGAGEELRSTDDIVRSVLLEVIDQVAKDLGEESELDGISQEISDSKSTLDTISVKSSSLVITPLSEVDNPLEKPAKKPARSSNSQKFHSSTSSKSADSDIDGIHSHLLLYTNIYDSTRTLYAIQTIKNILLTNARAFLYAAATTSLNARSPLLKLLARHRKSIFGHGFFSETDSSGMTYSRSSMYLEVLILISLYYTRSYYLNNGQSKLTLEEILGNRQVQISSVELLSLICAELCGVVRDNGRGFASYLGDLLTRVKAQNVVLHCILASVHPVTSPRSFTQDIVAFNDQLPSSPDRHSIYNESFQIQLLRFLISLLMLEYEINHKKGETETADEKSNNTTPNEIRYISGKPIPQQPMFISAIMKALEPNGLLRHMHQHWTSLVTCSLPYLGKSLTRIITSVIKQLCGNIELLSQTYQNMESEESETKSSYASCPVDYAITQLEALTVLCHYCLLDSAQSVNQPQPAQLYSNLAFVCIPAPFSQLKENAESISSARKAVLGVLSQIVGSLSVLWQVLTNINQRLIPLNSVAGSPRIVRSQLLELLSPIALHHASSFLGAVATVWYDRRPLSSSSQVLSSANEDQQVLVELVSAIKTMPIDTLVVTLHSLVKQGAPYQRNGEVATDNAAVQQEQNPHIEVSALELFLHYVRTTPGPHLAECWSSLFPLLRDAPNLQPPSQFLLFTVLSEFVHRTSSPLPDKKDQKDLQDITAKLIESCSQIGGACLEQTTWLRRNLAVREEEPSLTSNNEKDSDRTGGMAQHSVTALSVLAQLLAPMLDVTYGSQEKERVVTLLTTLMYNVTPYLKNHSQRNASSFYACSQLLASLSGFQYTRKAWKKDALDLLLDPALFQMEARSLPFWKTITDNLMSQDTTTFRDLLSRVSFSQGNSLSIFSSREQEYEQRAQLLKRLSFAILCSERDQFCKLMPEIQERLSESLRLPTVVPNVQAQVFLCFRVLLMRMSAHRITSLWPFIVSEMVQVFLHLEHELSSETEECSFTPVNIETKLNSTSTQIRGVNLRKRWHRKNKILNGSSSPQSKELIQESKPSPSQIRLLLDWPWTGNSNGLQSSLMQPQWLQLALAVAKLLDLALRLPADHLPQFQMYRWAFVGSSEPPSESSVSSNKKPSSNQLNSDFIPHVNRIAALMDAKFDTSIPPDSAALDLLPNGSNIQRVQDLHPFFSVLSRGVPASMQNEPLEKLEHDLELDFLEPMPPRQSVVISSQSIS
ncbi:protein DOP1 homolog isoform X2 [Bemisia tabaci]|uniref:protein DOP1 homolog isoform X2 n=1 Tax=Bemisia tabaci TaxID=7038 RepID=UPI003B27F8ED